MCRFDSAHPTHGPHPHNAPNLDELLAAGVLEISDAAYSLLTEEEVRLELKRFYGGNWGLCHDFYKAAIPTGWFLLACFTNSGNRFHLLTDESRTVTRLTLRGE